MRKVFRVNEHSGTSFAGRIIKYILTYYCGAFPCHLLTYLLTYLLTTVVHFFVYYSTALDKLL